MRFTQKINKKRKYILGLSCAVILGAFMFMKMPVQATDASSNEEIDVEGLLSDVQEKVAEALSEIDGEKVGEIFDFVKEKVSDGSLKTEEGLKNAIEEGETEFGITIDRDVAQKVVDVMEKLEDMGFSGEEIVDKAKKLYDTYGADFMAHANEAFTQVVEEAVENAVASFFRNLWDGIKAFIENLFKNLL